MRRTLSGVVVVAAVVLAGCGNASETGSSSTTTSKQSGSETFAAVDEPGVTADTISVGGVASVTNPIGGKFGDTFNGVQAYFDMVNSQGGIYGRKLKLAERRDDELANNKAEVDALIADQNIFAILPVAVLSFSGANDAVESGIPTFGWTINPEWEGTKAEPRSNLFGQTGSYLGFTDPRIDLVWMAKHLGAKKIGVLAYSVASSAECATGVENGVEQYGKANDVSLGFIDKSLAYGTSDYSVQVSKMKAAGVGFVATCLDTNGVVTLAKEMKKQQLDAKQYLVNAYDADFVKQFGDLFEGSIVRTDFTAWDLPADQQPPGLKNFLKWTDKDGFALNEGTMTGWINAAQFVDGLKAAGPDFTRQKVVDAINAMTAYTANGLIYGVDWTRQHTEVLDPNQRCEFKSTIKDSTFVPTYAKPAKPWHCVTVDPATGALTASNAASR